MDDTWESGVRLMVVLYREFRTGCSMWRPEHGAVSNPSPLAGWKPSGRGARNCELRHQANGVGDDQTVTRRGWIREITDPDDARITRLELTTSGRERLRLFESTLATRLDEILPRLSAETFRTFQELYHAHLTHYRMGFARRVSEAAANFPHNGDTRWSLHLDGRAKQSRHCGLHLPVSREALGGAPLRGRLFPDRVRHRCRSVSCGGASGPNRREQ